MLSAVQTIGAYQLDQARRSFTTPAVVKEDKAPSDTKHGEINTVYIAKEGAAPMEPVQTATLIAGVGIEGDRYALNVRKGTYSGKPFDEPGRNLTMVSLDSIQEKLKKIPKGHAFTMDKLRRNIVVKGLSAQDLNDMVGREVHMAGCRLFVHRRNVPCKYRQAETQCPNFMNTFWEDCGVCCEILEGGVIKLGDSVAIVPNTYQPKRCDPGLKPPGFFTKPAERTLEQVKAAIIPVPIAVAMCLWDPQGFERIESGYQSKGQQFWSSKAYRAGMLVKNYVRTPLLFTIGVGVVSMFVSWRNN